MVSNTEEVTTHFGYWPMFADGEIVRLLFESPGFISLGIRYGDAKTKRAGVVHLRFSGVSGAQLNELREQTVLDALLVSDGRPIEVRLEAAYGVAGSFKCESAAVVDFSKETR